MLQTRDKRRSDGVSILMFGEGCIQHCCLAELGVPRLESQPKRLGREDSRHIPTGDPYQLPRQIPTGLTQLYQLRGL
ncbi:hypothetical protein WJX74_006320 [Apatococcus lobatus]|uniref:Uncharacterized protein n=1 Tax=Apatococcus lobatus TaxID=904363 RepID=A0AAW1Q4M7_9CHLO